MNLRRNLTASIATIKEPINPTASIPHSDELKLNWVLTKSNPVAAAIVGIARRKENSTAVFLLVLRSIAPIIVAAARETPGTIEIDWNKPIITAFLFEISSILSISGLLDLNQYSTAIITIPPIRSAATVIIELPRRTFLTSLYRTKPTIAVGINAKITGFQAFLLLQIFFQYKKPTARIAPN